MYGVDQCRVCGTPITPHSRRAREGQEAANRNPVIPEEEWRRMGYLCPPTRRQLGLFRSEGCCLACGRNEMRKYSAPSRKMLTIAVMVAAVLATIFFVLTYMHH